MEGKTERLLRSIGSRESYAVIAALLATELTTSALARRTELSPEVVERSLEPLTQAGVVSRRAGSQGAWYIIHWPETFELLNAARLLGVAIQGADDHAEQNERARFAALEQAGRAAPAARRGRTSGRDD